MKGRDFQVFFFLWLAKYYAVLNGNVVEIIKFLLGSVDEERNEKIGKIYSMNGKWKTEPSLMGEKGCNTECRLLALNWQFKV